MMSIENSKKFDLKGLEAFLAAMSCGSMTKAAAYLGIGQPAVTRMIKELEIAVGFQLFHRNGPRISPTDRGLRFHGEVERVVAGLRQIGQRAEAIRLEKVASIDIAATPTMAAGLVGSALMTLGGDVPQQVNLQSMNAEHVVRALRNRTADFGVAANPIDHAGLIRHVICESHLVGVVAASAPLAQTNDPLPLSVFANQRLVTVGNAFRVRHAIDQAFMASEITPQAEFSTNTSLNAVMAARAGLGVAIVDPVTAYGVPVDGIRVIPLKTRIPYVWELLSDADRVLSGHLGAFVEAFRHACINTVPGCSVTGGAGEVDAQRVQNTSGNDIA